MAITFTKEVNGNIEFNFNGQIYSLPPIAVIQKSSRNTTDIILSVPEFSKFVINYTQVAGYASRDALFDDLAVNFFQNQAPGGGGGGDASSANQILQLAQETTAASQLTEINSKIINGGNFGLTAAGSQRIAQMTTLLDGKILGEDDLDLWENVGTGTAAFSANTVVLSVAQGQYMIRQTKRFLPYFAGKPQLIELTSVNFKQEIGKVKRIGYFSSNAVAPYNSNIDGFFLESNDNGYSLKSYNNDVITADKNLSEMTNFAAILNFLWENFAVVACDFLWLGGAALRFFVKTSTGFHLIHVFNWSGLSQITFMKSPNQPIRYEIRSTTGAGSLTYVCSQGASEGSTKESGKTYSMFSPISIATNVVGTVYAIKGIKKQVAFRDTAIQILEIASTSQSSVDGGVALLLKNPTLSSPLTYTNVGKIQEGTATNQTISALGTVIGAVPVAQVSEKTDAMKENFLSFLSGSINNTMDEYVLAFMPYTTNQNNAGVITYKVF